ncbi:MAG: hypothetical protein JWQ63_1212 [Mucilaginibacter sp.]|nr:hypothetical protein [Mucilaginibacter sp.]
MTVLFSANLRRILFSNYIAVYLYNQIYSYIIKGNNTALGQERNLAIPDICCSGIVRSNFAFKFFFYFQYMF